MLNSFSWLEWRKSKPNGRAALRVSGADYISSWEMLPGVAERHIKPEEDANVFGEAVDGMEREWRYQQQAPNACQISIEPIQGKLLQTAGRFSKRCVHMLISVEFQLKSRRISFVDLNTLLKRQNTMTKNFSSFGNELSLGELATIAAGKDGELFAGEYENSGKQVGKMTRTELLKFYKTLDIGYCISDDDANLRLGFLSIFPVTLQTEGW